MKVNVEGTKRVIEACKEAGIQVSYSSLLVERIIWTRFISY